METNTLLTEIELFFVIVKYGLGSKVIKIAKKMGVSGGTVFLGKGTAKSYWLDLLGLEDITKEIVLLIAEKKLAYQTLDELSSKLDLEKPNHGIAFSTSISCILGTSSCSGCCGKLSGGADQMMFQAIMTIVDKGAAEAVLSAAESAGAKGGTIINARGAGPHENSTLFSMEIEPEKEIVLILAESASTETIAKAIRSRLKLDEPGKGILFVLDANKTYGL